MLDLADLTLHLPGQEHMVTRCGLPLDRCQVGPHAALQARAERFCTDCYAVTPTS